MGVRKIEGKNELRNNEVVVVNGRKFKLL